MLPEVPIRDPEQMWLSLHIYCGRDLYGSEIDHLLVEAMAPLLDALGSEGIIDRFFFIRYSDPRSHVRLRLHLVESGADAMVTGRLEAALASFDAPSELQAIPYQPELPRYGGPHGVALAESHFHLSSRVALQLLAASLGDDYGRRLGKTLLTSVLLIHGWCQNRSTTAAYLAAYADNYAHYLVPPRQGEEPSMPARETLRRRLSELGYALEGASAESMGRALEALVTAAEGGEGLGIPVLEEWYVGLGGHLAALRRLLDDGLLAVPPGLDPRQALGPMVGSYLHMHHNRLGLSIPQEIYLAHLAATALTGTEGDHG